jgi:hypothetical protein
MAASGKEDSLICPHCIAPIGPFDHFCPHCGGPVTAHASMDPIGQIWSTGRAYQNAIKRPRLIAVFGMWLIFGTQLPVVVLAFELTLSNLIAPGHTYRYGDGSQMTPMSDWRTLESFKLLASAALLCLYVTILWKVTARYVRARRVTMHRWRAKGAFPVVELPPERGPDH